MTGRTGGEEWDSIPVSEDSQLRLENSVAPKLIPLTVCWVTGAVKHHWG